MVASASSPNRWFPLPPHPTDGFLCPLTQHIVDSEPLPITQAPSVDPAASNRALTLALSIDPALSNGALTLALSVDPATSN